MDNHERQYNNFLSNHLPIILGTSKEHLKDSNDTDSKGFTQIVEAYVYAAGIQLCALTDAMAVEELSREIQRKFYFTLVAEFNRLLPTTHNYILALVGVKLENNFAIVAVERKRVKGYHDFISQNVVPCYVSESREAIQKGELVLRGVYIPEDPADKE